MVFNFIVMNKGILLIYLFLLCINVSYSQINVVSITDASIDEGRELIHTITLSDRTTEDLILNFSFRHITTSFAGENSDMNLIALFDGPYFSIEPNFRIEQEFTLVVPEGISTFRFQVHTNEDDIEENDEQYEFSVDGVFAIGTILDANDNDTTSIFSVSNAIETEGGFLEHEVVLSNPVAKTKTFAFSLVDNTTDGVLVDYGTPVFSDNITYDDVTELITIPEITEGIASFTITIRTIDDRIIEEDEFYDLTIGTIPATGTIIDDDTVTISSVGDAEEVEGADLIHSISLSNVNPEIKSFAFSLIDETTNITDYGVPIFSNGVSINSTSTLITVPAGVSNFTVTIFAIDDFFDEDDESYLLNFEDVSATGTILNNDTFAFPKFFTPNNDNIHDTWPYDLVENNYIYDNAMMYVYDRYGRLLKQFTSESNGWDGTYNNKNMLSDDYWYRIILQDGEVHVGHFTLKR